MRKLRLYAKVGLATVSTLAVGLSADIGPASASVECGAVITTSTTLTHDLLNCPDTDWS